jgi:hypothetical protein
MKTLNLGRTMHALLLVVVGLIPTLASAQAGAPAPSDEWVDAKLIEESTDTAYERGSQAAPDPWTVSRSSTLFSRPTLSEAINISTEATEDGGNYSVAVSPSAFGAYNRFLDGLQVIGGYSASTQAVSIGLKWNLSLRDIRFFSREDKQLIFNAGQVDFSACQNAVVKRSAQLSVPEFKEEILKCGRAEMKAQDEAFDKALNDKWKLRPTFSAGASVTYGFDDERWGKLASNVAMELPISVVSLVVNGDFESDRGEDGLRHPNLGGSLALSYIPTVLEERVRVAFAGKVLECLDNCGEESSTVLFGPTLSYAFGDEKDSLVGISLSWSGKGASSGDAFLGLSLSHSIGPLESN